MLSNRLNNGNAYVAFSRVASATVLIVAALVLLGWQMEIEVLKRVFTSLVAMNPLTAVAFLLSSCTLLLYPLSSNAPLPHRRQSFSFVGRLVSLLLFVLPSVKLVDILMGWDSGIDRILFPARLDSDPTGIPNRMAPNTALAFLLLSLSLFALHVHRRSAATAAQILALGTALLAYLALAGYLLGSLSLSGVRAYIPMALNTAILFILLTLAIATARPFEGPMALFTSPFAGGAMLRRLLVVAFAVPLAFGWLRLMGERAGWYDTSFGVALFAVASTLAIVAVLWWTATSLERSDLQRRRVYEELQAAAARTMDLYNNAPCGYHSLGPDGTFLEINDTELAWLGYKREEVVGKLKFSDVITPKSLETFRTNFPLFKERGWVRDLEFEMVRKDGSTFPVLLNATAIKNEAGEYLQSRSTLFDITDRKQAEQERERLHTILQQHAQELEFANRELEAFSYSVSHDLRAPLRHIGGFVNLLQEEAGPSLSETARRYLHTIADSARQMGTLIDDLLTLSRMARMKVRATPIDTAALVRDLLRSMEHDFAGRTIDWMIAPLPTVNADAMMIKVVFQNLLENAIKYTRTRERALIEVGARQEDNRTVFWVRDNGVGFDMRFAEKLFGVFQRLHRADEFEGTGVGLASVRRIVHRHGGMTWAEGKPDAGATFYFSLPLSPDDVMRDVEARKGTNPSSSHSTRFADTHHRPEKESSE